MNLNTVLTSYNTIDIPETEISVPNVPSIYDDYQKRLLQWKQYKQEKKETVDTKPEDTNTDEYGFSGFTYNPTTSTPSVTSSAPIKASDNLKVATKFFSDKGFNNVQISGILGNLLGESALNPAAVNKAEKAANLSGYGRGIAQWSNSRVQDFENFIGVSPEKATLDQQLEFAWHEMSNRPALLAALKKSQSVDESTDAIYRGFENGSANALATPEQLTSTYGKAWKRLGYKPYVFQNELNSRIAKSQKVFNYLNV